MAGRPLHERLTVVITTSPVPSNPSTAMIEALLTSFNLCTGLAACRKVIVCDGCNIGSKAKYRGGQVTSEAAEAYAEYCDALKRLCKSPPSQTPAQPAGALGTPESNGEAEDLPHHDPQESGAAAAKTAAAAETPWANTAVLRLAERVGFAHAAYAGLREVRTEFVIVVQHDLAFVRTVDVGPLCDVLGAHPGVVNYITLPGAKHIGVQHHILTKYGIRVEPTTEFGPRLIPVIYWYDKTHLCRTDWYKQFVYEGGSGIVIPRGQFTEHELGFSERADIIANGMSAHRKYGTYQYDDGSGLPLIEHMNGRRFMTATQREAQGWPAERPPKVLRQKGRGPNQDDEGNGAASRTVMEIPDQQRRRYVLMLRGGLANRLRTVLGFRLVASLSSAELLINWKPAPACPGHFLDVYGPIPDVTFIDEATATTLIREARNGGGGVETADSDSAADQGAADAGVAGCESAAEGGEGADEGAKANLETFVFSGQATVKTILQRYLPKGRGDGTTKLGRGLLEVDKGRADAQRVGRLYSLLRPVPALQEQIDRFASDHNVTACVGLHIRRTDHSNMAQKNGRFTSDADFVARMERERDANPDVHFFLATDNPATQHQFKSLPGFEGRVVDFGPIGDLPEGAPSNARHTDLDRAVIDVHLLARCTKVHGSGYSSYSELAHHLRVAATAYAVLAQPVLEESERGGPDE